MPIDDILNSVNGNVIVEEFKIVAPNKEAIDLYIPSSKPGEPKSKNSNFDVYGADLGFSKIALREGSKKGVYTILANSKPNFYTQYIDAKGNTRLKLAALDEVDDAKQVLMSVKYQAFAKTYLTVGKWEAQKPTNKGLEIVPRTDLSNVRVGDLVEFDVLFNGKPLNVTADGMDYITAQSSSFGQNDGFALMSYIVDGKAQFRALSAGKWVVQCYHKENVTQDGSLKDLIGKAKMVFNAASLTFDIKE